jgi:alpha-amylase
MMKRSTQFSFGATFALALLAGVPESGCISVPTNGKQPVLATHVQDWRDEVIYQVLVDRFANGDVNNDDHVQAGALARFQGGDWKGMEDHLDYFVALGVTTLWISPVVKNVETDADVDAYHGYWAQDLTQTNPHFGDLAALRSLVASAHDRGLKVVLDIVTNHMGQVFYYDMNLNGHPDIYIGGTGCDPNSPASQYGRGPNGQCLSSFARITEFDPDWDPKGVEAYTSLGPAGRAPIIFINDPAINRVPPQPGILGTARAYHGFGRVLSYDDPAQRLLGDFPGGLKDVATELPEVRSTMVDAYTRWVELTDLDGFRIDTVKHVEHEFWQVFTKGVRDRLAAQGKKNFFMFGEAFDGSDDLLASFTVKGELDSVFYFSQHFQVVRDVFEMAHDPKQQKGTDQIASLWATREQKYGAEPQDNGIGVAPKKALVNFLDNHDVARFLFEAGGDVAALRNAITLLFTEQGIPNLYYGTEQEFAGGNDPSNREVLWNTGFATNGDTFRHIAKVARLRKGYAALRRGDTTVVYSSPHVAAEPDAGIFAFERAGGEANDRYALVVMNTNDAKAGAPDTMKTKAAPGATLVDVMDPAHATYVVDAAGVVKVSVPPQSTMILVPSDQLVADL